MKKSPIRRSSIKGVATEPPDSVKEVHEQSETTGVVMGKKSKKNEMGLYAKYSGFVENKLGLGRTGKRLAHGGATAGGTWAAGHYGGVEIINQNMPAALIGGAAAGIIGTVAMDHLFLSDEDQSNLLLDLVKQSSEEVQEEMLKTLGLDASGVSSISDLLKALKTG
jgi:hypothetical protein